MAEWSRALVVYFDRLLGAACTQKLVELLYSAVFILFCSFQTFFSDFTAEINKKRVCYHDRVTIGWLGERKKLEIKKKSSTQGEINVRIKKVFKVLEEFLTPFNWPRETKFSLLYKFFNATALFGNRGFEFDKKYIFNSNQSDLNRSTTAQIFDA